MSTNPLEKLVIDHWYKATAVAGLFVLIISLTVNLVDVENNTVQLISLGMFFIGLGEWKNHPIQVKIIPATIDFPGGKLTSYPRSSSLIGVLLDVFGGLIAGIGIYRLLL